MMAIFTRITRKFSEKSDIATAIWKDGPLSYDKDEEEWIRSSYEKVVLRFLYDSENITNEFINEVKSYFLLDNKEDYGISQNPVTRDYILIFGKEYFVFYCEKCGIRYDYHLKDYNSEYNLEMDLARKWCKSCHINQLKDNFINWTSGDEKIDNFIQKKQLNVMTSFDLIFEWIPYNELIEIKEIGKGELSTAIWKEGPLYYDNFEKEWMRNSYKKVVLKCLSNSQNLTDEFLNKATVSYVLIYGISQNPNTKDYILVIHITYYNKYCKECDKEYTKLDHAFSIWKEGPLCYNTYEIKWMRTSHEKVCLKYLYNSQNVIDELFINKVESFLDYSYYNISTKFKPTYGCYGISQNPDTKDYILILNCEYFEEYCEKCDFNNKCLNEIMYSIKESYGISQNPITKDFILVLQDKYYCIYCYKKYNNKFEINNKSCMLCQTSHENKKISDLIQEMKLNINYNSYYFGVIFEWVPYDQFYDLKEIGKGGFSTVYSAIWKDGLLHESDTGGYWRRKPNTRVALKCLHNSQNFLDEFINEVKAYPNQKIENILKIYGISQDPNTKNYIMVFEYAEGGSFDNYLDKNYESFDWFNGLKVLTNIINGLSEIHQKQMVHRDFHIGNILITKQEILNDFHIYSSHENNNDNDNNYNACISDMGLCRKIDDIDEASIYGVMPYVAPEVLRGKPYTQAADIYSFDQKFKKNKQHYEIEEQFKKTQEYRKENLLSIKNNNKSTTHVQAIYTSRLLNPFTKNLFSNSTVEITDFTE
ncbi:kinase-like domain-containing protein [Rhizophagus irregularis DAOM 181602=DAOM 197198]|nr:kinase-like domain-containing protein [Rhizophagus irregularis DAOM 181602=DAOM 197198]